MAEPFPTFQRLAVAAAPLPELPTALWQIGAGSGALQMFNRVKRVGMVFSQRSAGCIIDV